MTAATFTVAETKQLLIERIHSHSATIGVVGLGYVGLPLALLFSEERFPVIGFDIDARKVQTLTDGGSYIYRVPRTEIQMARERGFCATADFSRIAETDAIVICVPTPLDEHRQPDLSYVTSTLESIAPHLVPGLIAGTGKYNLPRHHAGIGGADCREQEPLGMCGCKKRCIAGAGNFCSFLARARRPGE